MRRIAFASVGPRARFVAAIVAAFLATVPSSASARPGRSLERFASLQVEPPRHQHVWVKQTRKEWVPPEKKVVQIGVDAKGKPIYESRIVKPGYWKTITYFTCSCGATKG